MKRAPDFCYQKAFWIVVPALIVIFSSLFGYLIDKVDANAIELAHRSIPIQSISELEKDVDINSKNLLIICRGLDFTCIEG